MHGYELRKRLNAVLGWGRALSYGSLYPGLKAMLSRGWISADVEAGRAAARSGETPPLAGRRARIVYELTADGKEHFQNLLSEAGPSTWEDENFGVHFAFFARTDVRVRLRILEGRRSKLEERLERLSGALHRTRERVDGYTLELQRHGLESVEREVRWLNELINAERGGEQATEPPEKRHLSANQAEIEATTDHIGRDRSAQGGQLDAGLDPADPHH